MSYRAAVLLAASLALGCAGELVWSATASAPADAAPADVAPAEPVDAGPGPARELPVWLEGSAHPCLVRVVTGDPRRTFLPEWSECEGIPRCSRAWAGAGRFEAAGAYAGGMGFFVHRAELRNEVLYTVARTDGTASYALSVPCERVHCELTSWAMGDGHVAFFGLTWESRDRVFWSPLDTLDASIVEHPPPTYLASVSGDRLGFYESYRGPRDGIVYVDRAGHRWTEPPLADGPEVQGRHRAGDLLVWWTEHELWVEPAGELARVVYSTEGFLREARTDGRSVAWSEAVDRYGSPCEVRLLSDVREQEAAPRSVHSGACVMPQMSEGRVLVHDLDALHVYDAEGGPAHAFPIPLRYGMRVLYLARHELLVADSSHFADGGWIARIEL